MSRRKLALATFSALKNIFMFAGFICKHILAALWYFLLFSADCVLFCGGFLHQFIRCPAGPLAALLYWEKAAQLGWQWR